MKTRQVKEIVLMLIRDDLVNVKLVDGLCKIDLSAEYYYLNISTVIFNLLGIDLENNDGEYIYKEYLRRCEVVKSLSIKNDVMEFDNVAIDLYNFLVTQITLKNGNLHFASPRY